MDLWLLRKILAAIVLPPTGPLLVAIAGLALLGRRPRLGRALAWTGVLALVALSTGAVAHGLARLLHDYPPLALEDGRAAEAIVVLGGGIRPDALEYGGDTLGRLTLERVRYGAWVARRLGLPVLVTGGAPLGGTPEAVVMRRALEDEYAIPVRWADAEARNTHENARNAAALLRSDGVRRVVLVTHGFHMRRARAAFLAAGLEVVPAPTFVPAPGAPEPGDFLPSVPALQLSYYALHELAANALRSR
jgi:uncharacterized SAM-binding protein YcdF (DUF218 family)